MPELRIRGLAGLNGNNPLMDMDTTAPSVSGSLNMLLSHKGIAAPRSAIVSVTMTSGPSSTVYQLIRHQPAADETAAELWAFSGSTSCHRWNGSAWSSVSLSDTVANWSTTARPRGASLNGKLFLAYNSDVNRLHVWDGTSVRRVGIGRSAAPSLADLGSGGGAAVIRYYKIQFKIKNGSDVVATSELSAASSITPAGTFTVRVTKPTTPDSATHWVVFGSGDGVTYYDISTDIAVGTTTFDDSAAPSVYSSGTVAPTAGRFVPPPSCKYLLASDNRLFMAGSWETSATGTAGIDQTRPKNNRVWFTDPLGAADLTGEDEAVAHLTGDRFAWVDCGENDGEAIVGLAGPLDGVVYVFKQRSIWRLVPTGIPSDPYRSDRITGSVGAISQEGIVQGEDGRGNPVVYFNSTAGPYMLTRSGTMEYLGLDLGSFWSTGQWYLCWDQLRQALWCVETASENNDLSFQPQFAHRTEIGWRGGWMAHTLTLTGTGPQTHSIIPYRNSGYDVPYLGGSGDYVLGAMTLNSTTGDMGTGVQSYTLTTNTFRPSVTAQFHAVHPLVLLGSAAVCTVTLNSALVSPSTPSNSKTATSSGSYATETIEGGEVGPLMGLYVTCSVPSASVIVRELIIPYRMGATVV